MRGNAIAASLILSLLLFSSVGAASWDFRGYKENTSSTTESGPAPPLKEIHTNYEIGGDWLAPIVHGNVVYLVRSHRYSTLTALAINISNEKILWNTNISDIGMGAVKAFYMDGNIYFDSGVIGAINASSGRVAWENKETQGFFGDLWENQFIQVGTLKNTNFSATIIVVSTNIKNGDIEWRMNFTDVDKNHEFRYQTIYAAVGHGDLYIYPNDGHLYAMNLTTKEIIWKTFVGLNNPPSVFNLPYGPIYVGPKDIYVPIGGYNKSLGKVSMGIAAVNISNGKIEWERITEHAWDFQYKFAYSPEYHMIVRVNISGYLIAMDSRDGHVLWISHVNDSKYADRLCDNVVIAHNYIYEYVDAWKYPNDMYNETEVGLLRMYNISNGKMVYQKELYAGGGEKTSLDLPGMAVTHGKVIIPEGYLQILEHDNGTKRERANIVPWLIGLSAVIVGGAIAAVIVWKKKSHN